MIFKKKKKKIIVDIEIKIKMSLFDLNDESPRRLKVHKSTQVHTYDSLVQKINQRKTYEYFHASRNNFQDRNAFRNFNHNPLRHVDHHAADNTEKRIYNFYKQCLLMSTNNSFTINIFIFLLTFSNKWPLTAFIQCNRRISEERFWQNKSLHKSTCRQSFIRWI